MTSTVKGKEPEEIARQAIIPMSQVLKGHNLDINSFAARYASSKAGESQIAAKARFEFLQEAVRANPALADPYVKARTSGLNPEERQWVDQRTGNSSGLTRCSMAEQAIREVNAMRSARLSPEERGDVKAMIAAGTSFADALRQVHKDRNKSTRAPVQPERPAIRLDDAAVQNADAERKKVQDLTGKMSRANRLIPNLNRGAEFATGLAGAATSPSSFVWGAVEYAATGSDEFKKTVDKAGNAGGYMAGELTDAIKDAKAVYMKFLKAADTYYTANDRYKKAAREHDYAVMNSQAAVMQSARKEMDSLAHNFASRAQVIAKKDKEFDGMVKDVIISLYGSAISAGISGIPGEKVIEKAFEEVGKKNLGKASGAIASNLYSSTIEGGAERAAGAATEGSETAEKKNEKKKNEKK